MTNYNERLDEILFNLCDLSYACFTTQEEADRVADQLDYDREEAKQALTSLIKELVLEARIDALDTIHKRLASSDLNTKHYKIISKMLIESKEGYREAMKQEEV